MEHRLAVSDNSMAVIFKLQRIQYALLHQDEVDKQDIFLLGAKDTGRTVPGAAGAGLNASLNQTHDSLAYNSIDLAQNSISNSVSGAPSKRSKGVCGIDVPEVVSSTAGAHAPSLLSFDKNCMQCGGPG